MPETEGGRQRVAAPPPPPDPDTDPYVPVPDSPLWFILLLAGIMLTLVGAALLAIVLD